MTNKRGRKARKARKTRKGGVRESRSLTNKLDIQTYNVIIKHKKQIIEELEDLEKLFKSDKSKRNPRHSHTRKNIKKLKSEIRDYKEKIEALKRKAYTK